MFLWMFSEVSESLLVNVSEIVRMRVSNREAKGQLWKCSVGLKRSKTKEEADE